MAALDSHIRQVTVYRRGAVITREVPCPTDGWPDEVVVDRLPLALDDGSVRVRFTDFAAGGPEATDVRVELWVPPLGEPVEPPSEAEIRRCQEEIEALAAELERLDEEQDCLEALELKLPPRLERKPPQPVSAQAWAGALSWTEAQAEKRDARRSELNATIQEAEEQLQRLHRQAAAARAERGVDEEALCKQVKVSLRAAGDARPSAMELEYRVPGACWRPSYVLRVTPDGSEASLAVRALLCQRTGEPWERVRLALSTADLRREVTLPELASIRIGRRQSPQPSLAWREPPSGSDSLFEDLDTAMADRPDAGPPVQPPPPPRPAPRRAGGRRSKADAMKKKAKRHEARAEMEEEVLLFEQAEEAEEAYDDEMMMDTFKPEVPPPEPAPSSAPMPQAAAMPAAEFQARAKSSSLMAGLAGAASNAFSAAPVGGVVESAALEEPGPARLTVRQDLFDYAQLRLGRWDAGTGQRGKLTHLTLRDTLGDLTRRQARQVEHRVRHAQREALDLRDFPARSRDVAGTSGAYDYVYAADGPVDVPADGAVHNVPLTACEAPVQLTLVVVPRESDQAVRVATLRNPLHSPLLEGEADIYLGGEFLITSRVATVPAGADLDVGLGVEEALKVARNTHFKEETEGLLGGSLALAHSVDIEVASRLVRPAQVEVRERLPVRDDDDDDDIKIKVGAVSPAWSDWDQTPEHHLRGGKRWRFELPAGGEKVLHYEYAVHIDSKHEIVGGNRRERS